MPKTSPSRRKVLLINPRFQLSFLAYTGAIAFCVSYIYFMAERYFFWKIARMGTESGLPHDHVFFQFVTQQQRSMDLVFAVTTVISVVVIGAFGLYLSNRVAGPLHRLRSYLDAHIEGGNTGPLKFRKSDYFKELENPINRCLNGDGSVETQKSDRVA